MIAVRLRSLLNYAIIASVAAFAVVVVANLFLGDKKIDAKLEHRYPVASHQFERVMSAMLGPALLAGNRAEALVNGDRIFPAMLEAIRAARKTITFEMYIYAEGKVGEEFTAAFEERARAGVRIHFLIWLEHAGKWRAKEIEMVLLKAPPDANIVVEVFGKFHQDVRQEPALAIGKMERVIRQRPLGLIQETREVFGQFDERSLTASKMSVRSVVMKSHGSVPIPG